MHGEPGAVLPVIRAQLPQIAPAVRAEGGGTLRDVAVEATAPPGGVATYGYGVRVGTSSFVATMTTSNVIARGPAGDMAVRVGLSGGVATMVVDHSNWATQDVSAVAGGTAQLIAVGGGKQTGPTATAPVFVDAAAGDYRTAAGSPTIDAGIGDASNGPLALGGRPRTLGAATDIGADEFLPPAPPAAPVTTPTPTPAGTPAAIRTAPVLTGLRMGRSWARRAGTTIRFALSGAATVRLSFSRRAAGRRVGRTCRATTPTNRGRPRCTRTVLRGTRVVTAGAVASTVAFAGRLPSRRVLTPGPTS